MNKADQSEHSGIHQLAPICFLGHQKLNKNSTVYEICRLHSTTVPKLQIRSSQKVHSLSATGMGAGI